MGTPRAGTEHKRPMRSRARGSAAGRVTTAGRAIAAVSGGAGAVSTGRYQTALPRGAVAVASANGARTTAALGGTFWQERLTVEHYLFNPSRRSLQRVAGLQARFDTLA